MSYRPPYLCIDYETAEDGIGSTEFYRPNFRVTSCAFAWLKESGEIDTDYREGEEQVRLYLKEAIALEIPFVVHNIQFEQGVTRCRYPDLSPIWHADTMRLCQVYDNGGGEYEFLPLTYEDQLDYALAELTTEESDKPKKAPKVPKRVYIGGLSLKNCAMRILNLEDPKKEAHTWLRENVPECKKGKEGGFLNRLPPALLRAYNIGDAVTTLKLYEHCTKYFAKIKYDWTFDHALYKSTCHHIVGSKIRGFNVNRESLQTCADSVRGEIQGIRTEFTERFAAPIERVERTLLLTGIRKRKTLKGRKRYLKRVKTNDKGIFDDEIRFNVGSNKQLGLLFIDQLGLEPRFLTATGKPAFRSAVLDSWGPGGTLLKHRRKSLLVLKQSEALLALSAFDGKWHCDLRVAGTSTGRGAGGT